MKIRPVQLTFKEFLEETVAVIEESSLQFFVELVLRKSPHNPEIVQLIMQK